MQETKTKRFNFDIPEDLFIKFREVAVNDGESMSTLLRRLMKEHVRKVVSSRPNYTR